jgi:hypothetical protein
MGRTRKKSSSSEHRNGIEESETGACPRWLLMEVKQMRVCFGKAGLSDD